MRLVWALLVVFALYATPAMAQPLPASLRSAGVTEAQWTQAQGVIRAQAASLSLREDAVRTLAVEIFEGQPGQSFETYIELIRDGAQRLPQTIAAARALDPRGDATLVELQRRAVTAAEAGRLREALALQDEYSTTFRRALERAVEQPLLDLAASYAAAGETAYALADYQGAAERYAEAAATAPGSAVEARWNYRFNQARALLRRGDLFNDADSLREAVRLYEHVVLPLAPRDTRPGDWGRSQNGLGWALTIRGQRGLARNDGDADLQAAVRSFRAALEVRTIAFDPKGYAETKNDLGWALQQIGSRGRTEALRDAVACHRAALALIDRTSSLDWARGQSRLGNALRLLGERGDDAAREEAVVALEAALSVSSASSDPVGWGVTQMNLGIALQRQGERGVPGALERAIAAYNAALTVRTRDVDPTGWAMTAMNLGNALTALGERGAPGALERAVAAYDAALTVLARESHPYGWAVTQMNLGNALLLQSERDVHGALERAIAAYEAALTVRTREADSAGWAGVQMNLGNALLRQGVRGVPGALERAIAAYEAALTVFTRDDDPAGWALTQMNLGNGLSHLGAFREAVTAYEAALTVRTRASDPSGWAETQYNRAQALLALRRTRDAREAAQAALDGARQIGDASFISAAQRLLSRIR